MKRVARRGQRGLEVVPGPAQRPRPDAGGGRADALTIRFVQRAGQPDAHRRGPRQRPADFSQQREQLHCAQQPHIPRRRNFEALHAPATGIAEDRATPGRAAFDAEESGGRDFAQSLHARRRRYFVSSTINSTMWTDGFALFLSMLMRT